MTTSTKQHTLHCSRCGAERKQEDLNGVNLTSTGWDDDSKAYCRRVADCESQEAADVLDWVSHCMDADNPDESINVLAPGDPLPEQASQTEFGFNPDAPAPVFGADYEPRPTDSENPESQTGPRHSNLSANSPAPDLRAVSLDQLTRASLALQQAEDSLVQARLAVQSAIQSAAPLIRVDELDQS